MCWKPLKPMRTPLPWEGMIRSMHGAVPPIVRCASQQLWDFCVPCLYEGTLHFKRSDMAHAS